MYQGHCMCTAIAYKHRSDQECACSTCVFRSKEGRPGCVHVLTPSLLLHASTRQQSFGWSSSPHPASPSAHHLQWLGSVTSHSSSTQWGPMSQQPWSHHPHRPATAVVHGSGLVLTEEYLDKGSRFDVLKCQELHVRVLVLELGYIG